MTNYLDGSNEADVAQKMAQTIAAQQAAARTNTSSNALVQQFGPAAADPQMQQQAITANTAQQTQASDIAATNATNVDKSQQPERDAQLRAAFAIQGALAAGEDGGKAWDDNVAPYAAAWGIDPAHAAIMRQHISQDPAAASATVAAMISGLAGPAKPSGAPENLRDANGQLTNQQLVLDDRGGSHTVTAPAGTTFAGPLGMAGAPKPEILPDGSMGYRVFMKNGQSQLVHTDGTPVSVAGVQAKAGIETPGLAGPAAAGHFAIPPGGATAFSLAMAPIAQDIVTSFPGAKITSGPRTIAQNNAAGGVADSAHLSGNAADFHIPSGMTGPQFAQAVQAKYPDAKVLYEGPGADNSTAPHVHVELVPPAGAAAAPTLTPVAQMAQQRLALAAQHEARIAASNPSAPLSPETTDYLAQQFRLTGKMPAMGMGGAALRTQVFTRAAQMAQQAGATGDSDVFTQQATKERGTAVNDLANTAAGHTGGRIQSVGAVVSHLDTLSALGVQLTSGSLPLINAAKQMYQRQTGLPAPTNFQTVKNIAADEVSKFLISNGGGEADRKQIQSMFDAAQSPAQLNGALSQAQSLLVGQLSAMRQRYSAIGATNDFDGTLTPRVRQLMGLGAPAGARAGAPAPGGGAPKPAIHYNFVNGQLVPG